MLLLGFVQSVAYPCIFIRVLDDKLAIVTVHVDDLILLTETEEEMINLKTNLANRFKTEEMGILHYCLRVANQSSTIYQYDSMKVQITRLQNRVNANGT